MAVGDNRLFTRAEIEAWEYDFYVNGNRAADLFGYWTHDLCVAVEAAVRMKLPVTVDEVRRRMGIVSPYSPGYPTTETWEHPDSSIGSSYLYHVLGDDVS